MPVGRFRPDVVLACADGDGSADGVAAFVQSALRRGARVSPPGAGRCAPVYRDRFAAPGRTMIACGDPPWSSGALGMLVLPAGALETAVVLAGAPYDFTCAGVLGVELRGELGPWVGGHDLALELLRPPRSGAAPRCILEFRGDGVKTLPMDDRLAVAARTEALELRSIVFPSDEATRGFPRRAGPRSGLEDAGRRRGSGVRRRGGDRARSHRAAGRPARGARVGAAHAARGRTRGVAGRARPGRQRGRPRAVRARARRWARRRGHGGVRDPGPPPDARGARIDDARVPDARRRQGARLRTRCRGSGRRDDADLGGPVPGPRRSRGGTRRSLVRGEPRVLPRPRRATAA